QEFELVELCPEDELGLGVPRPPIDVIIREGELRLWMAEERRDLTEQMHAWARERVQRLLQEGVRGAVSKARSPSCGVGSTPYLDGQSLECVRYGDGFYVMALRELAPELPIIDDEALADVALRAAFVAAVTR
ncbi:MAG: DUF523 domain-containing protein, partial [Deltaproteobacteria bacterium]|nr:DUF523 domain-containing protein [Deltaproteobacteria bacterium]